jgi:Transcriptional regulatory protein, C terminal
LNPRATKQTANEPQAANMISKNEALTKDQANVEGYRQNRGYQPDRQSVTTADSSFPGPIEGVVDLDQTIAPTNATAFIKGDTRIGKKLSVRAVHTQDAGLVIAVLNPGPSDVLVYGDVTISFSAMEVHRRGQLVTLTLKEFKTLAYLLKNARRVISRDELLNEVWGYQCYPCTRTVDNHILRLRKKLEPEPALPKHFRTVHGIGYKFLP